MDKSEIEAPLRRHIEELSAQVRVLESQAAALAAGHGDVGYEILRKRQADLLMVEDMLRVLQAL